MSITIWEPDDGPRQPKERISITVYPPSETKRPIGFAPWPKEKTKKRKKRER